MKIISIKVITIISGLLFICSNNTLVAQALKIGDRCPDLLLKNVINHNSSSVRLSQFKARLILLDFWSTSCISCIEAFPHIDSLQEAFAKELQILTVTYDPRAKVENFFNKRKFIKLPRVPFITEDTILHNLFPPESLPCHVWLDSALIVKHITFGSNSKKETIRAFLDGKDLQFYTLYDLPVKPRLGTDSLLNYYSYIAPCIPGTSRQSSNGEIKSNRIYYSAECTSITDFVKWTLGKIDSTYYDYKYPVVIEAKCADRFKNTGTQPKDEWLKENAFSYYLMLPVSQKYQLYNSALKDIEQYFKIKVVKEVREINCMVLEKMPGAPSLKSKGGAPLDRLLINTIKHPVADSLRYLRNQPFKIFINKIKAKTEFITRLPFVDETEIDDHIDISLSAEALDATNIDLLKAELEKWGLQLSKKERPANVIVIKDNE